MRAVITGAAGQIGSYLAEALLESGWGVIAIDNLSTGRKSNLDAARDVAEKKGVYYRFRCCDAGRGVWSAIHEADYVYNLAACVGVERVEEHPELVFGDMHRCTSEVIRCCVEHDVPMLHTSSSEIYGRSTDIPFREEADAQIGPPTEVRWSYALVKLLEEYMVLDACRRQGLRGVVVRLFNTVSPRQTGAYGMVVPRLCQQALNGERLTVHGSGQQSRCFAHVKDVVKCLLMLSQREFAGEVFNVGSTEEVNIATLAAEVLKYCVRNDLIRKTGFRDLVEYLPDRSTDMARRVPDVSKLKAAIGFVPNTPLATIVRDVIEGMRNGA